MGKQVFVLVIIGVGIFMGIAAFPTIHTFLKGVSTTGFSPLLAASVTFLPYVLVFFIIYPLIMWMKG